MIILLIYIAVIAIILGMVVIFYGEKILKNEQEIKTRLYWVKMRQLGKAVKKHDK